MTYIRSIKIMLPSLLFLVGLIAIVLLYRYLLYHEVQLIRERATDSINAAGTQLAGLAHYSLQRNDSAGLDMEVGLLAPFPDLTLAIVADGSDIILHSTQRQWIGQRINDTPLGSMMPLAAEVRKSMSSRVGQSDSGQLLTGLYAFEMPLRQDNFDTRGSGLVLIGLDLEQGIAHAQQDATRIAAASGGVLLLLTLLLWYMLHRLFTEPVNRLVKTAHAFEHGNFAASAGIARGSELGEISAALDGMALTARERAQALETSEKLAKIVENSVNEVYVFDGETFRVTNVNQAGRSNLGYTQSEILDLMPWEIIDDMTRETLEKLIAPLREGAPATPTFERILRRKNGSTYPVLSRLQYMMTGSRPIVVAIAHDITEQRRQHAQLLLRDRAIAEVDVGVLIADASLEDNPIVYVNPALEKMTGYLADEMLGQNPRFLQGEDRDQPELDIIRTALRNQVAVQVTLRNYRKDGSVFLDEVSISPVRDEENTVTHFIGIQKDVTDRVETEARLLHSQKLDAIGQLSGGIAHDFNNLLSVVTGNLEFLRLELEDPELLEFVDDAHSAARTGAHLTQRLLAFSRQSALESAVVDVNTHVQKAMQLLRSIIGETISLKIQLADGVWHTRVDPGEIENSVVNLVINARDAMPDGGSVLVETDNFTVKQGEVLELAAGDYARISVTDTGTGIPDKVISRIFEPFFTTKEEGKGTGLGLASIYGFAKQSGGLVTVESQPGKGSTMRLFLPRFSESLADSVPVVDAEIPDADHSSLILVVEDNPQVRKLTVNRLSLMGYLTVVADTGPKAVQIMDDRPDINLVLSDIVMKGGMSGYDVARWVQQHHPGCKILLTSGYNDHLEKGGGDDDIFVLPKPCTMAEFRQAISEVLDG